VKKNESSEKVIFQAQIPAKLILFGEWGILQGHPALGCSVGKYFKVKLTENSSPKEFVIECPEAKYVWNKNAEPPEFLKNTRKILEFLFNAPSEIFAGKRLHLERNWDLSDGLGSSSALFLSLLLLQEKFAEKTTNSQAGRYKTSLDDGHAVANSYRKKLIEFQKAGSGIDIVIQALGGFQKVEGEKNLRISRQDIEIPEEILLVHTGKKMKTDQALAKQKNTPEFRAIAKDIGASCSKFLEDKDWEKAISTHSNLLQKLGVVPSFISDLKAFWQEKKWIKNLKTTGAGGGDTLLLYINACSRPELEADIRSKGFSLEEALLGVKGVLGP
jgi:mevalonate kinase